MQATLSTQQRQEQEDRPLSVFMAYVFFWLAMAFTIVSTAVMFLTFFVGWALRGGSRWAFTAARLWGAGLLRVARCPVEVEFEAEPPQGGFFFYSNHQGMLDILALFVALRRTPFVFAAKRGLFFVPAIGWYLRIADYVEVDRVNRERAIRSYARAAAQVREGRVLAVYPEGTRSIDGSVLPFKKGAFVLALQTGRPIVPVAVEGAQLALRKNTRRLHGHVIRVRVGAAISTEGMTMADRDALLRRVRLAVLDLHGKIGGPPSLVEPMIAPPGRPTGGREPYE